MRLEAIFLHHVCPCFGSDPVPAMLAQLLRRSLIPVRLSDSSFAPRFLATPARLASSRATASDETTAAAPGVSAGLLVGKYDGEGSEEPPKPTFALPEPVPPREPDPESCCGASYRDNFACPRCFVCAMSINDCLVMYWKAYRSRLGNGCVNCVWTDYFSALQLYNERKAEYDEQQRQLGALQAHLVQIADPVE